MHIPDGWLTIGVLLLCWSFSLLALSFSFSKIKSNIDKVSNIGAIASVIFVAQMFNFPVAGGTTGHLLGAGLAVYILGLSGAIIALFSVLFLQAIVFADGGILALGANMFNMGVAATLIAFIIQKVGKRTKMNNFEQYSRIFLSAFLSVVAASIFASFELILSDKTSLYSGFPLIVGYHIIIGIFEGIITVGIVYYLINSHFPIETFTQEPSQSFISSIKHSNRPLLGVSILLLILSILAIFSFSNPDGLESASLKLFPDASSQFFYLGIANDYDFMGLGPVLGTFLSALFGILLLASLYFIPASFSRSKKISM